MSKKIIRSQPVVFDPIPYTAEENESRYNKDYGFNKRVSVRSPVSPWEDKYIREGSSGASPKEVKLVKGATWKGPHRRMGNSYGNRSTTRKIGKK